VEDLDTEYEDDSHAKKQKWKAGSSSRALKQCTPSDNGFELKEKKGKQPMRTLDASTLKGGSLSPSTVESSSDKQHSINKG
jgi:hypothetical protein